MPTIGVADVLVRPSLKGFQQTVGKEFGAIEKDAAAAGKKQGDMFAKAFKVGAAAIAVGATAVGAFATKGVLEFAKFEKGMNEVFTLLPGISKDAMGALSDDTRKFVREMGVAHEEAVPALYSAISAGVPKDNVFDFMEVAAKAAKGGVTDLNTAVDGITSAVNAFKAQGLEAGDASDKMFTAVRLGKTTFGELSASLFNVSPVAAGLGIKFGDVTASVAALTAQGVPTSVATTQMRAALVELSTAGGKAAETFEKASGKTFKDFIKSGGNVSDAFDVMADSAKKSNLGVGDLFGSVEAAGAVMSLSGDNAAAFKVAIAEMGASAGATDKAFEQMDRGLDRSWERIKIGVTDAALGFGEKLAPAVAVAADWLGEQLPKAVETLSGWLTTVMDAVTGLGDLLVKGDFTGKLTAAFGWEEDHPLVDFLLNVREGAQGLYDLLVGGDYTGKLAAAFGWEEDSRIVDFLLTVRDEVLKIPDALKKVIDTGGDVAKFLWDMREPIGVIVGLIVVALIPHWIALGVEALKSAAKQSIAWAITRSSAIKAAFVHSGAVTAMVAGWVLLGAKALGMAVLWGIAYGMVGADSIKAAAIHSLSVGKMIAGWALVAVQATVNAVKIAAAWFIALGPVGWIIAAVIGIGAAIWAAYENIGWFKDGVDAAISAVGGFFSWLWTDVIQPVFAGIGAAISWVYESIIKPVFDGISSAVATVGAAFSWFYLTIIKPVFDSIGVIINGFYLFFRGIFQLVVSLITYIVIPLFVAFWNRMVEAFTAIGATISDWWNGAVAVFNTVVSFVRDVLSAAFTWIYESIIKPVFDGIGNAIKWVWDNVIKPTFDAWVNVFTVVIPNALNWLYTYAIKPVFDAIGNAAKWVWETLLKPVFDNWVYFFLTVIPNAFNWLYTNAIKPVFDSIGNTIKWVWENVIKPVFDTLSGFITKTIPDAFNQGVDFIKKAWDRIIEIAKMPVRFVVDTVINDGLIGAFNTIAGILPGIDKLPRVALPDGFARGGILPGQSSWRHGDDQLVPMRKGEGVLVSEVMQDPYERARLYAMNKAAIMGRKASEARALFGEGFAKGGIVNPLRQMIETQGYNRIHKGVDLAASVGTPVFATESGRVSWSGPGVSAPGVWGGNEVHVDGGSGIQSWFAHLSSMAVKVGDMVRAGQQIALSGNTGISSGPHLHFGTFAGGWPNDINPYNYLGGAGVPSGGGFNPLAGIIDGLLAKFKEAFPAAGMIADIAIGVGRKLFGSVSDLITGGQGSATGSPALYDLGGILPPGISQVVNRTGKPEAILNPQQWADISRLANQGGGGRGDVIIKGNVGWDPHRVAQEIEVQKRRTQTMAGMSGVVFQ